MSDSTQTVMTRGPDQQSGNEPALDQLPAHDNLRCRLQGRIVGLSVPQVLRRPAALKSVAYQPLPFSWKPAADNSLL